jgi:hypothetical protein
MKKVVYLPQAMLPIRIGFTTSVLAAKKEIKRLGIDGMPDADEAEGVTHIAYGEGISPVVIVRVSPADGTEEASAVGLIAHESSHAMDAILEVMDEQDASSEFKAYTIQWLVQNFYHIWKENK